MLSGGQGDAVDGQSPSASEGPLTCPSLALGL
jgi:hypothetical protein